MEQHLLKGDGTPKCSVSLFTVHIQLPDFLHHDKKCSLTETMQCDPSVIPAVGQKHLIKIK